MENLITWGEIKDNHVLGYSILGKIWIRLNKEQKVTGIYLMWDDKNYNVEKIVPEKEEHETLEGSKKMVTQVLFNTIESNNLLKKEMFLK